MLKVIKPIIRAIIGFGIRRLASSQGVRLVMRRFVHGGSVVDILQAIVKLTPWGWDDKYIDMGVASLMKNAIDHVDGDENKGVMWYDLVVEAMAKEVK